MMVAFMDQAQTCDGYHSGREHSLSVRCHLYPIVNFTPRMRETSRSAGAMAIAV